MLDINLVRKRRTKIISKIILGLIEVVSLEELLHQLFLVNVEEYKEFITKYEKLIILAFSNSDKFKEVFYRELKNTTLYIKKNNLYRDYFNFAHSLFTNIQLQDINREVGIVYSSLIMEQASYFSPEDKSMAGISLKDNKPIFIPEPFLYLDYPFTEYEEDKKNKKVSGPLNLSVLKSYFSRYGYNIRNSNELDSHMANEKCISNMIFQMIPFINEKTMDMLSLPYYLPCNGLGFSIPKWKETIYFKDNLLERKYMLPSSGIKILTKNIGTIKSVFLKETLLNENRHLLYKIEIDDNQFINGNYDIKNKYFFSIWDFNEESLSISHMDIENLVLELYSYLTLDLEIDNEDRNTIFITKDLINDEPNYRNQRMIQILAKDMNVSHNKKDGFTIHYDKSKYIKINIHIDQFIRKLPTGAKASDNAKKLAESYGYKLKEGETFVKSFPKTVNIRKNE